MKTLKTGVVLLALMLAGMAMVPMVSADEKGFDSNAGRLSVSDEGTDISGMNQVLVQEAQTFAYEALIEAVALNQFGDSVDWNNAILDPESQLVYDLNGELLFYQFGIEKDGKKVGRILISANKVVGTPVVLVGTVAENQPDMESLKDSADKTILERFDGYSVISEKLVCYSYPKIGLLVELSRAGTHEIRRIVIDSMNPADVLVIPDNIPSLSSESKFWSYYNEIPVQEKQKNIIQWNDAVKRIKDITDSNEFIKIQGDFKATPEKIATIRPIITDSLKSGQLKLINYGYFPTTQQLDGNFCNIATAQIITTYYWMVGVVPNVRTQKQIAIKMDAWPDGGPTWANEENYYRDAWSSGGLGIDQYRFYFSGPGFTTIKEQVDDDQPFKIGLGAHARACYGYDSTVSPTRIYFSDPATGTKYYESLRTYNNHLRMNIPYP